MVGAASLLSSLAMRCAADQRCAIPQEGIAWARTQRGKARAASCEIALGEAKELIVALDCVEIAQLQTPPRS
jgi:hypothetical protein